MNPTIPLFWTDEDEPLEPNWFKRLLKPAPSFKQMQEGLNQQLSMRQCPSPLRWGSDAPHLRVGYVICRIAKEHFDWINDYFIPDDPFDIVFLTPWDDLDLVVIAMDIEEELEISLELEPEEVYALCGGTVNDFVELITSKFSIRR